MKTKAAALLALLPALACAGSISIGSSASPLTFNPPDITLGSCSGNTCTISGAGTLQSAPVQWSIVTNLSGGTPIQESGIGPAFSLNQEGATITFSLTDTPGPDSLSGSVSLTSASDSFGPDLTDIVATLTYSSVNLVTPALKTYLMSAYGSLPTVGSIATLDLTVTCGATTECIPYVGDPNGTVVSSTLTASSTPEPGTLAMFGAGIVLFYRLRRRR